MEKWRRLALLGPLLLMSCGGGSTPNADNAGAEGAPADGLKSETHVFEEIGPGIYFATGTGKVNVGSNAMVVVNENDVLLVDSHITPDAARELIASVAAITDKPIRYLVNSHFHFDHAHGNQEFPDGVEIIGHECLDASKGSKRVIRLIGCIVLTFPELFRAPDNGTRDLRLGGLRHSDSAEVPDRCVLESIDRLGAGV